MAESAASVERSPSTPDREHGPGEVRTVVGQRALDRLRAHGPPLVTHLARHREAIVAALVGLASFLALAPLLAIARQVAVLAVAGLVGTVTDQVEVFLLPLLPVDPVYGGAGLRVLGGIEPRGLAVAGFPGALLHSLLPALIASPELAAPDAAVSALVGPGVTVLARLSTALLATAVLLAVVTGLSARLTRPAWKVTAVLVQVWLLIDLAHETDLGVRDLELTGLPFALAAFSPVDAHGQRVLVTSYLEALPDGTVAGLSAGLAIVGCLLSAALLYQAGRLGLTARRCWTAPASTSGSVSSSARVRLRLALFDLPRLGTLAGVAVLVSLSPLATFAEGETAVLMPESVSLGDAAPVEIAAQTPPAPEAAAASDEIAPAPESAAESLTEPSPAPVATPSGSLVTLEGGSYRYTLRVDGEPTVVRGMGYNPWYASLPEGERRQHYRRDFKAMQEIGVNTLEGWFQNQFDEVTLDEADRHGLKVIMPFELNQDYDYSDPAIKAMFRQQVTEWVLRYRDHPAVLMWGPGNEVMHRLIFPTAVQGKRDPGREQRADDFAAFYVELIDMIRAIDPDHPVVYRDAEDLYFERLRTALLRDGVRRPWFVYGTNVYTQRIADVIGRWPTQGLDAPLLISEFSPGGSGAAERPGMLGWYWSTIRAHPERVLGGVVYTWATQGPEDLDRVFGLTDPSGAPVDGSLAALRQLYRDDLVSRRAP